MPGYFPEDFIERVRETADIVEVISQYVTLKKSGGSDFLGLCPFHNEKTPSFRVHSDRGFYKCFGCGKGGNVYTFLMEIEGLSFPEAVKHLAERYGLDLPHVKFDPNHAKRKNEKDQLFNAMHFAAGTFHKNLLGNYLLKANQTDPNNTDLPLNISADARKALEYLIERGITLDIISRYQIGWAENSWDHLVNTASRNRIHGNNLVKAGLARSRRDGSGFVDAFRARVMFPIINLSGYTVAFGGRKVDGISPEDESGKYINSPETDIYRKSDHLYGLYTSRDEIRKKKFAYLVEGYTDLLALVQAGVTNVIASLGTALTENHARLIRRFADQVLIVYDGDDAGINAAKKASIVLSKNRLEPFVVQLPQREDPDSYLRQQGAEKLKEVLSKPQPFVRFILETSGFKDSMGQTAKLNVARDILELARSIHDPITQDAILDELKVATSISLPVLRKGLMSIKLASVKPESTQQGLLKFVEDEEFQFEIIRAFLSHPEIISENIPELKNKDFSHVMLKHIFEKIEQLFLSDSLNEIKSLPDFFDDPRIQSFITDQFLWGEKSDREQAEQEAKNAVIELKIRKLRTEKFGLESEMSRNKNGDNTRLWQRLIDTDKQIRELQQKKINIVYRNNN